MIRPVILEQNHINEANIFLFHSKIRYFCKIPGGRIISAPTR